MEAPLSLQKPRKETDETKELFENADEAYRLLRGDVSHMATEEYVGDNAVLLTGNQTVAGQKTFSDQATLADTSRMATSAAPVADSGIVNKKYVDDRVYVSRGDLAAFDYTVGDFITNENWQDLDISGKVGAGKRLVLVFLRLKDGSVNVIFAFRPNGNSNTFQQSGLVVQTANVAQEGDLLVETDANGKVEYWGTNTTFTNIDVTIKGYWVLD